MKSEQFAQEFAKFAFSQNRFVISGHVRPDGDSFGSCSALGLYLASLGKKVYLYAEGDISSFPWLWKNEDFQNNITLVRNLDELNQATRGGFGFIMVDLANPERTGEASICMNLATETACIDHHVNMGEFAQINWIDANANSACLLVDRLFQLLNVEYTPAIAQALFSGIASDTGGFRHSNMDPATFGVLERLSKLDVPITQIMNDLFHKKRKEEQKTVGYILYRAKMYLHDQVIVSSVTRDEFAQLGTSANDCESAVGKLMETEGVEVAVFLRELAPRADQPGNHPQIRINLRSKEKVDVAKIAGLFGGGGHIRAAGATSLDPMLLVKEKLLAEIEKQLSEQE